MPTHPTGAGERRFVQRVVRDYNSLPVDTRSLSVPAFRRVIGDVLDVLENDP